MDQELKKKFRQGLQMALNSLPDAMPGRFPDEEAGKIIQFPMELGEMAGMEHDRGVLVLIQNRYRELVWEITKALERIEEDEFGICEICGDPIDVERLKVQPTTTTCIDCQRGIEWSKRLAGSVSSFRPVRQWLD